MALADLIRVENNHNGDLEEILAALASDDEVEVENERWAAKIVQIYPAPANPAETQDPSKVEELILSADDVDEALEIIEEMTKSGELYADLALKGGCREIVFDDEEKGLQSISFSDVSGHEDATPWAGKFMHGIVLGVNKAKKVTAKLLDGTKILMIAGNARQVGIARDAFAEAMRLAGLDVKWGGFRKDDAAALSIASKMEEYGIRAIEGENGHITYAFDALENIPQEHRGGALRVIIDNCIADYQNLSAVITSVDRQFDERKEYARIKVILDRYEIAEEGLRHLLANSISAGRLDPDGKLLTVLNEKATLLATANHCHKILAGAINKALSFDSSLGDYVARTIPGIRVLVDDRIKDTGKEEKVVSISASAAPKA